MTQKSVTVVLSCSEVGANLTFTTDFLVKNPAEELVISQNLLLMINYTEVAINSFSTDANGFLTFTVANPMQNSSNVALIATEGFFPHLYIIFPVSEVRILLEMTTFTWSLASQGNFSYEIFAVLQEDEPTAYPVHPSLRPEEAINVQIVQTINRVDGKVTYATDYVPVDWYAKKGLTAEGVQITMETEPQTNVVLEFDPTGGKLSIVVTPNRIYYSSVYSLTFPSVVVGLLKRYLVTVNIQVQGFSEHSLVQR